MFDFDYVHEIIFSYGKLSLNRSISCDFKVEVIFKWGKFGKQNKGLQSSVCLHYYFVLLEITDMQNREKIF